MVNRRQLFIDFVAARCADMDLEAQQLRCLQPGVGHVVAIAHPRHRLASNGAAVLDVGEDVGQDLARVVLVGQAVADGYARVGGKALDLALLKGTDHHQIHHAADDLGAVLDGLGAAQLAVARRQVDHRAAQLVHAGLKAHTGPGAGLLEDHGQRAVYQRVVFFVGLELLFDDGGALEQVSALVGSEVSELQVMFQRRHGGELIIRPGRPGPVGSAWRRFRQPRWW